MNDVSQRDSRVLSVIFALILFCLSAFLAVTLLLVAFPLVPVYSVAILPADILLNAYGYSSFLVPLFLLFASIILAVPGWTVRSGLLVAGSVPVFFTAVAGEKILGYLSVSVGQSVLGSIISTGVLVCIVLVILVEYILLLQLADYLLDRAKPLKPVFSDNPSFVEPRPVPVRQTEHLTESLTDTMPLENLSADESGETSVEEPESPTVSVLSDPSRLFGAKKTGAPVAEPEYVDMERMRAPFDLPVIDSWVEPEEDTVPDEIPHVRIADIGTEPGDTDDDREDDPEAEIESDADGDADVLTDDPDEMDDFDADTEPEADDTVIYDELVDELFDQEDDDRLDEPEDPFAEIEERSLPERIAVETVPPAPPSRKRQGRAYSVPFDILTSYPDGEYWVIDDATRRAAIALKETLNEFRIQADVTGIRKGPVITMFEILPAPGVKLSKIVGLQDNIALRLAASSVRIVAPIPGKHAVGIEVPNQRRAIVSFRELIETDTASSKKMEIPVILGKDIAGEAQLLDLASTPHLLIAGSTGSGKSVCVNSIILSILYKRSPDEVKLLLIDPKIVELKLYNDIGHLLSPVITEPKKAFQALQYCLCEMERRYALLDGMGVRDIKSYNRRIIERHIATEKLPYLVVIIDEFADLMATTGKELESTVARLCAMSRAVGIHLVLATQRPSIDVITGLIKANIPTRIAFMVASKMDSRIIIDQVGAEKLLGRGDMLYASATDPFPVRIQGAFVSEEEVERVVEHVKTLGEPDYIDEEIFVEDDEESPVDPALFGDGEDPLYDKALEIVLMSGKASASYIQRKLKIGYNRAARLVEDMEARGIVGPANGSKPRELIHHP